MPSIPSLATFYSLMVLLIQSRIPHYLFTTMMELLSISLFMWTISLLLVVTHVLSQSLFVLSLPPVLY